MLGKFFAIKQRSVNASKNKSNEAMKHLTLMKSLSIKEFISSSLHRKNTDSKPV
jgi:hypothetical protein